MHVRLLPGKEEATGKKSGANARDRTTKSCGNDPRTFNAPCFRKTLKVALFIFRNRLSLHKKLNPVPNAIKYWKKKNKKSHVKS